MKRSSRRKRTKSQDCSVSSAFALVSGCVHLSPHIPLSRPFRFHLFRRHFQNLMLLQLHICPDETSEYDWLLWMIVLRLIWGRLNWKWQHMELFHVPLFSWSTHSRLSIFVPRWYWRSDGAVYRSQCFNNTGNIWLPVWGTVIFFNSKLKCMRFFL